MIHIRAGLCFGILLALSHAGCDGTSTGATDAVVDATNTTMTAYAQSCDLRPTMKANMLYCQEFVTDATILTSYKMSCASSGGSWSTVGCNRTGALGGCKTTSNVGLSTVTQISWYYIGGYYPSADSIKQSCASSNGMYLAP